MRRCERIGFPCALKPTHIHEFSRHFRLKAMVVDDEPELREAFARDARAGVDMILTEIIPGEEHRYCSYFTWIDEDGEFLFDFTKRKLRQYPVGFGGGTYHLTEWADDVAETGRRFLRAAGVRGLANVEFKRDPRDRPAEADRMQRPLHGRQRDRVAGGSGHRLDRLCADDRPPGR